MQIAASRPALWALLTLAFGFFFTQFGLAQESKKDAITLDRIMSDPAWIARSPERAYWADDSETIYYQRQQQGSELKDWFQSDLTGEAKIVEPKQIGSVDSSSGVLNKDKTLKAYDRAGDLFIKNLKTGEVQQLTRTHQRESSPVFMTDGKRLMFSRDGSTVARDLKTGLEEDLVDIRMENDPEERRAKDREGYLKEQQIRLFEVLRKQQDDQDAAREKSEADKLADETRLPEPWYLGDSKRLEQSDISPDGKYCLVVLAGKSTERGTSDKMPEFVDASGYVNIRNVRSLVGTDRSETDKLYLLNLETREKCELKLDTLPDFDVDRLEEIRAEGKKWLEAQKPKKEEDKKEKTEEETTKEDESKSEDSSDKSKDSTDKEDKEDDKKETKPDAPKKKETSKYRTLQVTTISWNEAGTQAVVQVYSDDHKDRWIASVDFKNNTLVPLLHEYDPAWVNRGFGQIGWLDDDQTIYYLSEQTGYSQLYLADVTSKESRPLTSGKYVVSEVQLGQSGKYIYYQANVDHPGIYEIYRVDVKTGKIDQLTKLGGMNDYVVSPDESKLLVTHSEALSPPELWIQNTADIKDAKQLTHTIAEEFQKLPWIAPQYITVPSVEGQPIYARLYLPPSDSANTLTKDGKRPAVIFIHGAGYLQNAHQGWSHYFREFMFHSLLAYKGYVVLDMDYRASSGYGRDWRTAIYRHMGKPEVDDLISGRDWLAEHENVDPKRVGIYGGSYGGFLTMMALFTQPGAFACGAALRPVTDWAHDNHGYTSNILNTPEADPIAYAQSSPIEFAAGLEDPLLICHGMVDDNVFFKDTARLAQRLIEFKKENWEVALYPVEPHGFLQPSSWYDEYRRILKLFETELN